MYLAHMDRRHGYGCVLHMDNSLISLLTDSMRHLMAWPIPRSPVCTAGFALRGAVISSGELIYPQITQQHVVALMQHRF